MNEIGKIWSHVKFYKRRIYKTVIVSFAVAGLGVLTPFALGRLIDKANSFTSELLFAGIVVLYLMYSAKDYFERYISESKEVTGFNCDLDFRIKTYDHLNRLPVQFHQENGIGEIKEKTDKAAYYITSLVNEVLFLVLPEALLTIAVFTILLRVNYLFSAIIFATLSIYTALTISISKSRVDAEKETRRKCNEFASYAHDMASNLSSVKSLRIENDISEKYLQLGGGAKRSVSQFFTKVANREFLQKNILTIGSVTSYGLILLFLQEGKISIGEVIMVVSYITMLVGPFSGLARQYGMIRRAIVSINDAQKILDEPEEQYDAGEEIDIQKGNAIKIENLCFSPNGEGETLNNVSMEIPAGVGLFAIVGESGSGKTTLWKMLLRYLPQKLGKVSFGKKDIREIKISSLRKHILSVERTILFDKSIAFNVAIGNPVATKSEIEAAIRAVCLDYLIDGTEGLNRLVGCSASQISNGEIQRILIARALLNKEASVYIFDEPTQSLDPKNAAAAMKVLESLSMTKKVIVITHALQYIVSAKQIYIMDRGQLIEQGNHGELMAQSGKYAEHFRQQNKKQL